MQRSHLLFGDFEDSLRLFSAWARTYLFLSFIRSASKSLSYKALLILSFSSMNSTNYCSIYSSKIMTFYLSLLHFKCLALHVKLLNSVEQVFSLLNANLFPLFLIVQIFLSSPVLSFSLHDYVFNDLIFFFKFVFCIGEFPHFLCSHDDLLLSLSLPLS